MAQDLNSALNSKMTENMEKLFTAMDTIISKRIENLPYDQTILCTIEDSSNSSKGEYIVTDGTTSFKAFSNVLYGSGDQVYVSVPKGDFTQDKIIIGKYIPEDTNAKFYTYKSPMESYVDITGNLIENDLGEIGLVANGSQKQKIIWSWSNMEEPLKGYELLGLTADFRSWLGSQIIQGNYGLRLDIIDQKPQLQNGTYNQNVDIYHHFFLDTTDMYGDPYNFETFYKQEIVFDISQIESIYGMNLVFFQNSDFIQIDNTPIPADIDSNNLFVKNPFISVGYAFNPEKFKEDTALLYTFNTSTYVDRLTDAVKSKYPQYDYTGINSDVDINKRIKEVNHKILHLRWIRVEYEDNNDKDILNSTESEAKIKRIYAIKSEDELPKDLDGNTMAKIHWYRYHLTDEVPNDYDKLAGPFWVEMPEFQNKFKAEIDPDLLEYHEMIKVIIESPSEEYVEAQLYDNDELTELKNQLGEIETVLNEYDLSYQFELSLEEYNEALKQIESQVGVISAEKSAEKRRLNGIYYQEFQRILSNRPVVPTEKNESGENVVVADQRSSQIETLQKQLKTLKENYETDISNTFKNVSVKDAAFWTRIDNLKTTYRTQKANLEQQIRNLVHTSSILTGFSQNHEQAINNTIQSLNENKNNAISFGQIANHTASPMIAQVMNQVLTLPEDQSTLSNTQKEYIKLVTEARQKAKDGGYKAKIDEIETAARGNIKTCTSNIVEFLNEDPEVALIKLQTIKDLTLTVDEAGFKGNYNCYSADGSILNDSEARKSRIITAKYTTLLTGESRIDTAEKIIWKIPKMNTMIQPPEEGIEYKKYDVADPQPTAANYSFGEYYTYNSTTKTYARSGNTFNSTIAANKGYYLRNDTTFDDSDSEYYIITRTAAARNNIVAGTEEADTTEQYFRIKAHYTQTASNNIIRCEIIKNNKPLEAQCELYFGPTGTNGTDYTFTIAIDEKIPAVVMGGNPVSVTAKVLDYNGNDVTHEQSGFKWSWYSQTDSSTKGLSLSSTSGTTINLNTNTTTPANYMHYILKCECQTKVKPKTKMTEAVAGLGNQYDANASKTDEKEYVDDYATNDTAAAPVAYPSTIDEKEDFITLTTYLCIPVRSSEDLTLFDGTSNITYNTSGVDPNYYKDPFKIYYYDFSTRKTREYTGVEWNIEYGPDTKNTKAGTAQKITEIRYYPQIDAAEGKLTVPAMYLQDNGTQISIYAKIGSNIVFILPLYISQRVYTSAMMNSWDGSLTFDKENGTILSAMVGAGYKDKQNQFNGIMMGRLDKVIGEPLVNTGSGVESYYTGTGLYGYNAGIKSFGFNINGKAFLGKSGRGQILMDGNSGTIQSSHYLNYSKMGLSAPEGMKIDMDRGTIDIRGRYANYNGQEKKTQAQITLNPFGTLNEPYFAVVSEIGNPLIFVGKQDYHIQSDDYRKQTGTDAPPSGASATEMQTWRDGLGKGLYFDIKHGELKAYNFSLKSVHQDEGNAKYNGSYIALSDSGAPYFTVHYKNNEGFDILEFADDDEFLEILYKEGKLYKCTITETKTEVQNPDGTKKDKIEESVNWHTSTAAIEYDEDNKATIKSGFSSWYGTSTSGNTTTKKRYYRKIVTSSGTARQIDIDLINITKTAFVLQSHDWVHGKSGMQIDIAKGTLTGYNFNLTGIDQTTKSYFKLSSAGNPYFEVVKIDPNGADWDNTKTDEQTPKKVVLMTISKNDFTIRSTDFFNGHQGGIIDFGKGSTMIKMYHVYTTKKTGSKDNPGEEGTEEVRSCWVEYDARDKNYPINVYNNFRVNWDGKMWCSYIDASTGGKIGPFKFDKNGLWKGLASKSDDAYDKSGNIYFGSKGISLGTTFKVTDTGSLTATSGTIGGFTLSDSALTGVGTTITPEGITTNNLTATGGTIAGWKIGNGTLTNGTTILSSDGLSFGSNHLTSTELLIGDIKLDSTGLKVSSDIYLDTTGLSAGGITVKGQTITMKFGNTITDASGVVMFSTGILARGDSTISGKLSATTITVGGAGGPEGGGGGGTSLTSTEVKSLKGSFTNLDITGTTSFKDGSIAFSSLATPSSKSVLKTWGGFGDLAFKDNIKKKIKLSNITVSLTDHYHKVSSGGTVYYKSSEIGSSSVNVTMTGATYFKAGSETVAAGTAGALGPYYTGASASGGGATTTGGIRLAAIASVKFSKTTGEKTFDGGDGDIVITDDDF